MQFRGGYSYPSAKVCLAFSVLAILATGIVAWQKSPGWLKLAGLFLSLEGTVLLASAFTPTGLTTPPGGAGGRIRWFFAQEDGVPLKFSQPLFYLGLLGLFLGTLLGAVS
jgi:hypothetical protein